MNKKQKKMLIRIMIAAVWCCVFLIPMKGYVKICIVYDPISGHWI